jgi:hypothetical protein
MPLSLQLGLFYLISELLRTVTHLTQVSGRPNVIAARAGNTKERSISCCGKSLAGLLKNQRLLQE